MKYSAYSAYPILVIFTDHNEVLKNLEQASVSLDVSDARILKAIKTGTMIMSAGGPCCIDWLF